MAGARTRRGARFYFAKLTGLFFQSAGILLSANVVGKDKRPLGVERLVRLRLCGTELIRWRCGCRGRRGGGTSAELFTYRRAAMCSQRKMHAALPRRAGFGVL